MRKNTYKKVAAMAFGGLAVSAFLFTPNVSAENTTLRVNVGDVISITAPSKLSLTAPTGGGFVKGNIEVTVNTNSADGYTLTFASNASAGTLSSSTTSSTITSTYTGTKTSSSMSANTWGFATDNTNFSKIPASATPTTIKTTSTASVDSSSKTTIQIGIKTAPLLPSGKYSGTVVFTAVTN